MPFAPPFRLILKPLPPTRIKKNVSTLRAAVNLAATAQANYHKAQVYMQKTFKEEVEKMNKAMNKILEIHNK